MWNGLQQREVIMTHTRASLQRWCRRLPEVTGGYISMNIQTLHPLKVHTFHIPQWKDARWRLVTATWLLCLVVFICSQRCLAQTCASQERAQTDTSEVTKSSTLLSWHPENCFALRRRKLLQNKCTKTSLTFLSSSERDSRCDWPSQSIARAAEHTTGKRRPLVGWHFTLFHRRNELFSQCSDQRKSDEEGDTAGECCLMY